MLNAMALNLQSCRPRNLTETDHDHEDQMPTHVIWGEVESVSQGNSLGDATDFSGSQTCSDQGNQVKKKKLKNTRLNHVPHHNRELLSQSYDIQFRSSPSDKTTSSPHEEDEVSEGNLSTDEQLPQQQQTNLASLSPEELQELRKKVPLNHRGEQTSIGSIGHDADCRPCLFVHSRVGCSNGILCDFCHFTHKRRSRPRPCKGKRNRYRKLMDRMEKVMVDSDEPDPQALDGGDQARRQRGAKKQGGREARSSDGLGHHAECDGDASLGDCQRALGDMRYNADLAVPGMAMRSNVRAPILDRTSQVRSQLPQGFTHGGVPSQVQHNSLWHTQQEMPRYMNNADMQPEIPPYVGLRNQHPHQHAGLGYPMMPQDPPSQPWL